MSVKTEKKNFVIPSETYKIMREHKEKLQQPEQYKFQKSAQKMKNIETLTFHSMKCKAVYGGS